MTERLLVAQNVEKSDTARYASRDGMYMVFPPSVSLAKLLLFYIDRCISICLLNSLFFFVWLQLLTMINDLYVCFFPEE